jgi:hypothetical protein
MPVRLSPATKSTYRLEKTDEEFKSETPTMISVHLATQGDVEARNELWADYKRVIDGKVTTIVQRLSFDDVRREEVFLTLASCDIEDADGKPLFTFKNDHIADKAAFRNSWNQLPPLIANEIHEKVLEANVVWKNMGEA